MRRKLGEILKEKGAASQADIDSALSDQSAGEPSRLGDMLVSLGKVTSAQLAQALSEQYALPYVDLPAITPAVLGELPRSFQVAHRMVPFQLDGNRLSVALADPSDSDGMSEVKRTPGRDVVLYVAAGDEVDALLSGAPGAGALVRPAAEPAGALTADDLFADLSLDSTSGVRPAVPVKAPVAAKPAAVAGDDEDFFAGLEGPSDPATPEVPAPPKALKGAGAARPSPKAPAGARPSPKAARGTAKGEGAKRGGDGESAAAKGDDAAAGAAAAPRSGAFGAVATPASKSGDAGGRVAPVAKAGEPGIKAPAQPAEPAAAMPGPAAPASPSGLYELKGVPEAPLPDAPAATSARVSLPDWLKAPGAPTVQVPVPEPVAPEPAPPPLAPAFTPGVWSGELDSVAPSRLATAAVRVLVTRGIFTEAELKAELEKK